MAALGSMAWGRGNSGNLNRREQLAYIVAAMRRQLKAGWKDFGPFQQRQLARLDLDRLKLPDSALAQRSEALCRELSAPFLVNHCLRTYLWGLALGQAERLAVDEELLYVAALLHDLGLTTAHAHSPACDCFALRGALAAQDHLHREGCPQARAERILEAIALHMNTAEIGAERGVEARLLQAGASFDVVGARFRELERSTVTAVLERYPRLDCKREFMAVISAEAKRHPQTRVGVLSRVLMFSQLIRLAPFRE